MSDDPDQPAISVVIPAHDASATIGAQLDALVPQVAAPAVEVVVVDNTSRDATRDVVRGYTVRHPEIRIVAADDGRGPSYARNVGARAARGDVLLFCDADDVVDAGWVAAMSGALRDHDYVGGPIEVMQLNPTWLADGRGRWGVDQPGVFGDLPFAHGCNLGIRRATYLAIGGLDESLHVGEEIDLAIRLRRAGVPLHFVRDALVHYRYRSGLTTIAKQAYSYGRATPLLIERGEIPPAALKGTSGPRRILWLLANVPSLGDRARRIRWTWTAANMYGRAVSRVIDR